MAQLSKHDQAVGNCIDNIMTDLHDLEWRMAEVCAESDDHPKFIDDLLKSVYSARFTLSVLQALNAKEN